MRVPCCRATRLANPPIFPVGRWWGTESGQPQPINRYSCHPSQQTSANTELKATESELLNVGLVEVRSQNAHFTILFMNLQKMKVTTRTQGFLRSSAEACRQICAMRHGHPTSRGCNRWEDFWIDAKFCAETNLLHSDSQARR